MNSWVKSIKLKVTSKYCAFVDGLEDDLQVGEVVLIYSWKSVEERNETNEIEDYLPSHISIGNDSGDNEFLIRRDGAPNVYQCDAGALGSDLPEEVHPDITEWIELGCPVPDDRDELALPLQSSIWLLKAPENGLKGMFELRKELGQSWPASEMKTMMEALPSLLVQDGHPFALSRRLEEQPHYLTCLGYGKSSANVESLSTQS